MEDKPQKRINLMEENFPFYIPNYLSRRLQIEDTVLKAVKLSESKEDE